MFSTAIFLQNDIDSYKKAAERAMDSFQTEIESVKSEFSGLDSDEFKTRNEDGLMELRPEIRALIEKMEEELKEFDEYSSLSISRLKGLSGLRAQILKLAMGKDGAAHWQSIQTSPLDIAEHTGRIGRTNTDTLAGPTMTRKIITTCASSTGCCNADLRSYGLDNIGRSSIRGSIDSASSSATASETIVETALKASGNCGSDMLVDGNANLRVQSKSCAPLFFQLLKLFYPSLTETVYYQQVLPRIIRYLVGLMILLTYLTVPIFISVSGECNRRAATPESYKNDALWGGFCHQVSALDRVIGFRLDSSNNTVALLEDKLMLTANNITSASGTHWFDGYVYQIEDLGARVTQYTSIFRLKVVEMMPYR